MTTRFVLRFLHVNSGAVAHCEVTVPPSRRVEQASVNVSVRHTRGLLPESAIVFARLWRDWFSQVGRTDGKHPIPPGWKML